MFLGLFFLLAGAHCCIPACGSTPSLAQLPETSPNHAFEDLCRVCVYVCAVRMTARWAVEASGSEKVRQHKREMQYICQRHHSSAPFRPSSGS